MKIDKFYNCNYFYNYYIKYFKNEKNFNWDEISSNELLSEDFIEKYIDKINFNNMHYYNISDEFIIKYKDKINWELLSTKPDLSINIIKKI